MLLAALLVVSAQPAPVSIGEVEFAVERWVRVVTRASEYPQSDKNEVSLAVSPEGRIGIAWQSRRQLNGYSGVYQREFDRHGLSLGGEIRAGLESRFHEAKPAAVYGSRLMSLHESAWRDDSGVGVFSGTSSLPQSIRGDQTDVSAARLADGRILSVWSGEVARSERRVFGRLLDSRGNAVGDEFRLTSATDNELLPTVAASNAGTLVAWQSLGNGIRAATYSEGRLQEAAMVAPNGVEPSAAAGNSGFAIAWAEPGEEGYRARAQLISADSRNSTELTLPIQPGHQNGTSVAVRADGVVAVAWNLSDSQGNSSIWARLYSRRGKPLGDAFKLHTGSLAVGSGKQRIGWSGNSLCVAWAGDSKLGDAKAANLTVLHPADKVGERDMRRLSEAAAIRPEVESAKPVGDLGVQFITEAGPHEPPTFNPRHRIDPWGSGIPQGDGSGFTAVVNTGWTPPDPHMAVGQSHVGVVTNGQIAFFLKDGTEVLRDEIENSFGFWGSLGTTNFVFDPEVIYDETVNRWFAMACERGPGAQSYFLLAVSAGEDPAGSWFKYRINVTALAGGDIDSPNMSSNEEALFLSADFFTPNQKYLIYIIQKSDLLAGNPAPLTRSHLISGTQSHGMPMTHDGGTPQYLIEHFEASNNTTVRLHAISDPLGTPTRATFTLNVPQYGPPEDPPQSGTSSRPNTFDSRFWSCVYRNGSLWATHHINSARVLARWYEIRMNNWPNGGTPVLVQSGDIDPGAGIRTFFSSIAVDQLGNAAVVCARSSQSEFISMFRAARRSTDALGTMTDQAIMKASNSPHTSGRWGDYSGATTDPGDGRTFWGHHEYAEGGSWRTWVGSFVLSPIIEQRPVEQIIPILAGPITGGLPEIASADGSLLRIDSVTNPPNRTFSSSVDYISTAPAEPLIGLDVKIVARAGTGLGFGAISLYNFDSGVYDLLGNQLLGGFALTTFTLPASENVNRYIDPPTRQMRMRFVFSLGPQPTTIRPPLFVDEIKFITSR